MKTLSELKTKVWYRLFQIIYVAILVTSLFVNETLIFPKENYFDNSVMPVIMTLVVLEVLKRIIYYLAIGKIFPPEFEIKQLIKSIEERLSKIKVTGVNESFGRDIEYIKNFSQEIISKYSSDKTKTNQNSIRDLENLVYYFFILEKDNFSVSRNNGNREVYIKFLYLSSKLGIDIDDLKLGDFRLDYSNRL